MHGVSVAVWRDACKVKGGRGVLKANFMIVCGVGFAECLCNLNRMLHQAKA